MRCVAQSLLYSRESDAGSGNTGQPCLWLTSTASLFRLALSCTPVMDLPRSTDGVASKLTSLLWPPDFPPDARRTIELGRDTVADLDVEPVVQALAGHELSREPFVTKLLTNLCMDAGVIAYRAPIITNLLEEPELHDRLAELLVTLSPLVRERGGSLFGVEWTVTAILDRLRQLELYVEVALCLAEALDTPLLRAPGLRALQASIQALIETAEFETLRAEVLAQCARLDAVQSITIGVNLSLGLQPESATILSLDPEKIEGRGGLLQRLLGKDTGRRGITNLRGEPRTGLRAFFSPMTGDGRGHENELVQDLRRLLERVVAPVGEAIERFASVHTRDFVVLESELSFMLNGAALLERLRRAGLPVCRPEIAPTDARVTRLEESYNVGLALRMMATRPADAAGGDTGMVTNPVTCDEESGRVWILTGPNRGGKTTYARAIGLAHLLFQAGLYVPARSACMSPVDGIYTHFPNREGTTPGEGRLDEEAKRLAEIFREATPFSLVLLNEVLAGTSTLEALALARDAVRGLRLLGVRAIYVTHLHDLAKYAEEINATTTGDGVVGSLVAEVADVQEDGSMSHRRTFRIRPGPPLGLSYASEIAEQHGISYQQLLSLLESRGLIGERAQVVDDTGE